MWEQVKVFFGRGIRHENVLPTHSQTLFLLKLKIAHSPEFMLVEGFLVRSDKERFDGYTRLQQILHQTPSARRTGGESDPLTVNVVRADVINRGLCSPASGSSSSVMRKTRFVADFGALRSLLLNAA